MRAVAGRSPGASSRSNLILLCTCVVGLTGTPALANLVQNPSFEIISSGFPVEWNAWNASPDLLGPGGGDPEFWFGTGAAAYDGDRFVGVFSAGSNPEAISQTLTVTLTPLQSYQLSAQLLEADPSSFTVGNGGFDVWLGTSTTNDEFLGTLTETTLKGAWQFRAFTFTAPINSESF